jgi:hypothetical protein
MLEWTFIKPNKPGPYLYRVTGKEIQGAIVFEHGLGRNKEFRAKLTGTYMDYPLSALAGEWAGPIPEPVYKKTGGDSDAA